MHNFTCNDKVLQLRKALRYISEYSKKWIFLFGWMSQIRFIIWRKALWLFPLMSESQSCDWYMNNYQTKIMADNTKDVKRERKFQIRKGKGENRDFIQLRIYVGCESSPWKLLKRDIYAKSYREVVTRAGNQNCVVSYKM
jgi:hypothetical protein